MPTHPDKNQPEQVPGDAESPPKGTVDQTTKKAIVHPDKTEPVQTGAGGKSG